MERGQGMRERQLGNEGFMFSISQRGKEVQQWGTGWMISSLQTYTCSAREETLAREDTALLLKGKTAENLI